jgi:TonB family protein
MKTIFSKQTVIVLAFLSFVSVYAFTNNALQSKGELSVNTFHDTTENKPLLSVEEKNDEVYEVVEVMPEYPGGTQAMIEFISANFVYPDSAKKNNIQGRVLIKFIVDKDGSISDVKTLLPKDRHIGYGLEEEAIRVISAMPNWIPGTQRGKAVRVQYILPVSCKLEDKVDKY